MKHVMLIKKLYKKATITMLAAAVFASLAACGKTQGASGEDMTAHPEYEETESADHNAADSQKRLKNVAIEPLSTDATIEETILFDEDDLKITATGLSYSNYSVDLELTIENNSDQDLAFTSGSMGYSCNAINGYMVDGGYLNADVAAGKKANEKISFDLDELAIYGIMEIANIQVGFSITDKDYNRTYSGPRQVRTSAADSYDYTVDTYKRSISSGALEAVYDCTIDYYGENELYEQEGIRIISETLMTNRDGEQMLLLEIENQSSGYVYGATTDIAINGLIVHSGIWSNDSINPGARRIMDLSLSSMLDRSYWEAFGISAVGELTCSFAVMDTDYNELLAPQEISIVNSEAEASLDDSGAELYNENGIRIISKGIMEDPSKYSDDIHMLLLAENDSAEKIKVDDVFQSLSVNGYMTDSYTHSVDIPAGKCAVIDVEIQASSLESNGISGIDEITEAEISFEVKNDRYKTLVEPKLSIQY